MLPVYKPDTQGCVAPKGGWLINHNIQSGRVILPIYTCSSLLGGCFGNTEMMSLLSVYSIRIAIYKLAALYSSVTALLVKCIMAKQGAELILPSLLANISKHSKDCHKQFRLDMGEWTESSDVSSTESEVPKPIPTKN